MRSNCCAIAVIRPLARIKEIIYKKSITDQVTSKFAFEFNLISTVPDASRVDVNRRICIINAQAHYKVDPYQPGMHLPFLFWIIANAECGSGLVSSHRIPMWTRVYQYFCQLCCAAALVTANIRYSASSYDDSPGLMKIRLSITLYIEKAYDSVKREVLYDILIEFGIPKKLVRLIKICLSETNS
ncbi:hypothetical protein ANN_09730 [Periplaneta americana]|uniref:Uncharacterized protein n=1 Tax=Periplaneta americana TaxID=6978 RepID=A0ABQ8TPR6_PERAM|nr:hypothetical protein ANN_09730 [Periplaneta americana]